MVLVENFYKLLMAVLQTPLHMKFWTAGVIMRFKKEKRFLKNAVFNMADATTKIMERNQLNKTDVQWLAAHQANKRIINATAERMGISPEKVMMNIEKYGNTTSATLPLLLNDYETQLKKGDTVIFAAFGGGFSWGSIYLKWAYYKKLITNIN